MQINLQHRYRAFLLVQDPAFLDELRRIELAKPNPMYLAGNQGVQQQPAYQMPQNTGFFSAPVAGMELER
jgi:hypothetical protein